MTANVNFIQSIRDSIDSGENVVCVYMDLLEAFHSVCHGTLLRRLNISGVRGTVLQWLHSYLYSWQIVTMF